MIAKYPKAGHGALLGFVDAAEHSRTRRHWVLINRHVAACSVGNQASDSLTFLSLFG